MSIKIYYDDVEFRLRQSGQIKKFLGKVIMAEKRRLGDLIFIFTNDEKLLEINIKYLNHDYYTDVIAFEYNDKETVNGEIYISIDSVKRNAVIYKESRNDEFIRVMIHGTLHLCGYRDSTEEEKAVMKEKQELNIKEFRRF